MQEVKIRYLAQGILTIPNEDLPAGWEEMSPKEKWEWVVEEWWTDKVTGQMLAQGIEDCDNEAYPGLLEVLSDGADDHETLTKTKEYHSWFNAEDITSLYEGPEAPQ